MAATAQKLMSSLLDYVVEQSREIDPRAYNLNKVEGFKRYSADFSGLPGIDLNIPVEGDHLWLRVERLQAKSAPVLLDDSIRPFVVIGNDPAGTTPKEDDRALAHRHATDVSEGGQEWADEQRVLRRKAVTDALGQYAPLWQAWAAGEVPRRRSIGLYGELFALKSRLESEETARPSELVWGVGVTSWRLAHVANNGTASGVDFVYPLLTQTVELELDDKTHAISVRPRAIEPRLEFDAFGVCQVAGAADVERSAKTLLSRYEERPLSPFDVSSYEPILKLAQGNLSAKGRYDPDFKGLPPVETDMLITGGWVLLMRPRSNNFLIEDIRRLKERINAGDVIPDGSLVLVTPPSEDVIAFEPIAFRGLSGQSKTKGEPRELYFPLPYNHEQETIVEQLERAPGVAVQGPPGTGKTHTIANIICHYLASGRKVLVTSKGEPALDVLQSKIPLEVRPLTVALLSGDKEGMRQFQTSIEAIIHNLTHLIPRVVEEEIATCKSAIDAAHSELANIDRRVDDIAMSQLQDIEVDGIKMRAQKMAELVINGQESHGWFDDTLTLDARHAPPFGETQASTLRDVRRKLGADLCYVVGRIPSSDALLPAASVGHLHNVLLTLREIDAAEASGKLLSLRALTPEVLDHARTLLNAIDLALRLLTDLEERDSEWVFSLREKCRRQEFDTERQALEALFREVDELLVARSEFMKRPVSAPREALELLKAREAIERAAKTGKPFGIFAIGASEIKPHVGAIRIAGLEPGSTDDWEHVHRYVELHSKVLSFTVRWNQFAELLSVPALNGGVEQLRQMEQVAVAARKAHSLATIHDAHLPTLAERVFERAPKSLLRGRSAELSNVREQVRRHLTRAEMAEAATNLATLQEKLAGASGPVSDQLRSFVNDELGNPEKGAERIVARYSELVNEVRRVEALAIELDAVRELSNLVDAAGAEKLAVRLRSESLASTGEDRILPVRWRDAWNWARIRTHLESIEARDELIHLASRRRNLEKGLATLYEQLVSKSAWLSTKSKASAKVLSALETYRTAIRRIGQGTGPNATRHRRDAQRAMMDAQDAVPCWIMNHARVSETLPAKLGSFDLVIVDEASQSDLWALPAVLRGKRILVVGDDKQVSPDGGFVAATAIQQLRDRFLGDQPYAAMLTPEKSLYDLASTVFAASKVSLREHFRCVPPIIAYSNRVFYKDFIQPLRIPRASERIDPPLVDVYVANGHRDNKDINRPEVDFIVAEILAILKDPKLAHRTLGVVSLLGPEQAQYIDTQVRAKCDAAELIHRHFACGDARVFQGSERDIMFLSLVADSKSHKALSGNMFEQRFNVAASRARDRMYLARSVRLEELSPLDLRLTLLAHFSKPLDGNDEAKSLIDLCESGFETQVYTALFERGYRVIPQVKAGAFRIDMVVEGANDTRLAIECDGDEFHGPDRWQADMGRQRVLERAGWVFWRCFASTWSMRKDEVLRELFERLANMGIEPMGALERTPSLVEYREWGADAMKEQGDVVASAIEAAIVTATASRK